MANIILPPGDIVRSMSITAAITDGQSIFISYDSLSRLRTPDGVETIIEDPDHKVVKINDRTAIGVVGTCDAGRRGFIKSFAHYNRPFVEFDQIFNNLMMDIMRWSDRRPEETICISLMGFNEYTPTFRSVGIEGLGKPKAQTDYTTSIITGDLAVQDRMLELISGHAFKDIQGELHQLVTTVVEENPAVVGPPIHSLVLHP